MAAAISTALIFILFLLSSPFLAFSMPISPSPAPSPFLPPRLGPSSDSPSPLSPTSPSPVYPVSPPSPPLDGHSPASEPAPVPSPAAADVRQNVENGNNNSKDRSGGGMSGGRKAGVAIAVLAAAAFVGVAVVVYRKRQENLRRARYGYNSRMMEMI